MKTIAALLAGILVAFFLVMVVELVGHKIWPPPAGMDVNNVESIRAAMPKMSMGALASVAAAWVIGAFGGSWVAARVARTRWPSYIVGGLVALSGVANLLMLPHPGWFWAVAVVLVPLAALASGWMGARPGR